MMYSIIRSSFPKYLHVVKLAEENAKVLKLNDGLLYCMMKREQIRFGMKLHAHQVLRRYSTSNGRRDCISVLIIQQKAWTELLCCKFTVMYIINEEFLYLYHNFIILKQVHSSLLMMAGLHPWKDQPKVFGWQLDISTAYVCRNCNVPVWKETWWGLDTA